MLGGGNARRLKRLPEGARLGDNEFAFKGGFRLWRAGGIGTDDKPRAAKVKSAN